MKECCDTCRFVSDRTSLEDGKKTAWCRRYPPRVISNNGDWGLFPKVWSESWCGEWKMSGEAAAKEYGQVD